MRERERPGAQPVEHPQHGQARADRVARLHRDEAGDLVLAVGLNNVYNTKPVLLTRLENLVFGLTVCGLDEHELVRVGFGEPLDKVDLLQGHLHGVLVLGPARGVSHPQLEKFP